MMMLRQCKIISLLKITQTTTTIQWLTLTLTIISITRVSNLNTKITTIAWTQQQTVHVPTHNSNNINRYLQQHQNNNKGINQSNQQNNNVNNIGNSSNNNVVNNSNNNR